MSFIILSQFGNENNLIIKLTNHYNTIYGYIYYKAVLTTIYYVIYATHHTYINIQIYAISKHQ